MKTYHYLILLFLVVTGCSSLKINPVDIDTAPIIIRYEALQGPYPVKNHFDYKYPQYDLIKSYADKINAKHVSSSKEPYISILLSEKNHPMFATYPEYEIQGTDLAVHLSFNNQGLNKTNRAVVEIRASELLIPLSEKLGFKNAKLIKHSIHNPNNCISEEGQKNDIWITSTEKPKPIASKLFDEIRSGMTMEEIIMLLGKGWMQPYESAGVVRWFCEDGRTFFVWPSEYKINEVVYADKTKGRALMWITSKDGKKLEIQNK